MFVWITFLGAILALRRHALLGIELIQAMLPRWARRICSVISHVLILYALWLFLIGSWDQTLIGMHTYSTVLRFPTALMSSSGVVCAGSMMLIVAVNLLRILTNHLEARMAGDPVPASGVATNNIEEAAGAK
jgi:TRAP-type transport system small permease protein